MKIGRRKYNRGRIVEGVWLLGMIDVATNQIRLEFCPENKRDSNTLLMLIKKHVSEDSTIFTDCWKGYANLSKEGFVHHCVNHKLHFVDPDTKVETNKTEAQWRPVRKRLSRTGIPKEALAEHLCEFLWRRDVERRDEDPFKSMIDAINSQFSD